MCGRVVGVVIDLAVQSCLVDALSFNSRRRLRRDAGQLWLESAPRRVKHRKAEPFSLKGDRLDCGAKTVAVGMKDREEREREREIGSINLVASRLNRTLIVGGMTCDNN